MTTFPPALQSALKHCQEAAEHFAKQRDQYRTLRSQQGTHEQSAAAAEASAQSIKAKARALLRQVMGKPSKELHELRADERVAYSLAEDYRLFATETGLQVDEQELETSVAKDQFKASFTTVLHHYGELAYQETLAGLTPLLKAVYLRERVLAAEGRFAAWKERGFESAFDCAWFEISSEIRRMAMEFELDRAADPIFQQIAIPQELDTFTSYSPAQLSKKRVELAQRKEALA